MLIVAIIVIIVVAAGVIAWYASRQARHEPMPPERSAPEPGPEPRGDRDTTWNPVDRYED